MLPHDALIGSVRSVRGTAASGYFQEGVWEYRKSFVVSEAEAGSTFVLEFEGVYRNASVLVNGNRAAFRPYGYSGFTVDVTDLLRFGESNELRVEARIHKDSRWYTGAGIYRDVWLLCGGPLHLGPKAIEITTPEIDDQLCVVLVGATVQNRSIGSAVATLRCELLDGRGEIVASSEAPLTLASGDVAVVRRRMYLRNPRRWGPDHPELYLCRVTLFGNGSAVDQASDTFGVRTLSLDPFRGLTINGQPTLLRGACVHHDNGVIGAATIGRAEQRRVEFLKAAGFNAIRSAHNPMSRAMLDACDRFGMLVIDEAFDMWTESKSEDDYSLQFEDWWERDVEATIEKDMNHPSVICYSIGNEIPEAARASGVRLGRAIAEKVHSLDSSRFITEAINGVLVGGSALLTQFMRALQGDGQVNGDALGANTAMSCLADELSVLMLAPVITEKTVEPMSYLDVAGYNYMEARFGPDHEKFPERIVVSTESYPAAIDTIWSMVRNSNHIIGDFTWTGWDYLGEAGMGRIEYDRAGCSRPSTAFLGEFPWLTAWCGDFDIIGQRRPQSYYREIVFGRRSVPYIAVARPETANRAVVYSSPWSWRDVVSSWSWPAHIGMKTSVEVYSDADEVELLINGVSLGRRPAGAVHRFRAAFEATIEEGLLEAVAWNNGDEVGRTSLRSASGPVILDIGCADRTISADGNDLAFVEISLADQAGWIQTTADRMLTIEIEGPGKLQGFGNARPYTGEGFSQNSCTTFDGRALAVVRPAGPGPISITLTAPGCEPGHLLIDAT
jgi:beta-galactosidase